MEALLVALALYQLSLCFVMLRFVCHLRREIAEWRKQLHDLSNVRPVEKCDDAY